jgi:hypothetical protein
MDAMSEKAITALAESIASDLFTNGQGERARRLVLESEAGGAGRSHDLGGWSEDAVRGLIRRRLRLYVDTREEG